MSSGVLVQAPVLYQGIAGSLSPESTLASTTHPACMASTRHRLIVPCVYPRLHSPCQAPIDVLREVYTLTRAFGKAGASICRTNSTSCWAAKVPDVAAG